MHFLSSLIGHSSSAVRNSNEFARFIIEQSIEEDEVLVSFDVVSLFTNIPTNLAVEIARRRLENGNTLEERTGMNVEEIVSLLELCLNATYFTFKETHYRQCFGTLASTTALQSKEDKHIHNALKGNGYPRCFIHKIANQVRSQLPIVQQNSLQFKRLNQLLL